MKLLPVSLLIMLTACAAPVPLRVTESPISSASPEVVKPPDTPTGNQFNVKGIDVQARVSRIMRNGGNVIYLDFKITNNTTGSAKFDPTDGNVTIGNVQFDADFLASSKFPLEMEPKTTVSGAVAYAVSMGVSRIPDDLKSVRLHVKSVRIPEGSLPDGFYADIPASLSDKSVTSNTSIRLTKGLQYLPASPTSAAPTASEAASFNAEIPDPLSNCRADANKDSAIKKVLQKGDVLIDIANPKTDRKGDRWYREQYLGCWIHHSQVKVK